MARMVRMLQCGLWKSVLRTFEDGLLLNDDKINRSSSLRVGDNDISPVTCARNLGVWFDEIMSMSTHITKACSSAFFHLHKIRRIEKYLSVDSLHTIVHALITSRLDYCNSLMYGLPNVQISKLQRVQNAAARLIMDVPKFSHKNSSLRTSLASYHLPYQVQDSYSNFQINLWTGAIQS